MVKKTRDHNNLFFRDDGICRPYIGIRTGDKGLSVTGCQNPSLVA